MIKTIGISILLLITSIYSFPQDYSYNHYTIKDGLPQSQVTCIYQDHKGYMWIGTKAGLTRFDGIDFKNYYMKDGLSSDYIEAVVEDKENTLYVLTDNGYNKFARDTFYSYVLDTNQTFKWPDKIIVDSSNALWSRLQEKHELVKFENRKYTFVHNTKMIPDSFRINSFFYDKEHNRLFFSAGGNGVYYIQNNELQPFWQPERPLGVQITQSPGGTIYGVNRDSIYQVKKGELIPIIPSSITTKKWDIKRWDKKSNLFIQNGRHHLLKFNGEQVIPLKYSFTSLNAFFIDDENNIWAGTETGLTRSISNRFLNFTPDNSGIIPYVYSVIEDSNKTLYFASLNKGLVKYNGEKFKRIKGYKDIYPKDRFYMGGICDFRDNLILPTSEGAIKYDGKEFSEFEGLPADGAVLDIYEDPENKSKWFASEAGVYVKNKNGTWKSYQFSPGGKQAGNITAIQKDTAGNYWIGGFDGLSRIRDSKIHHLPVSLYNYKKGAICIYMDYRKNLWFGTRVGLYFYDYQSFRKVANNRVYSYVVSLSGADSTCLAIGMINQLVTLNLQDFYEKGKENIRIYNHTNGFMGNECIQNGMYTDSKGYIWIPTSDRVVRFDPRNNQKMKKPPRIFIEEVRRMNNEMEWITIKKYQKQESPVKVNHKVNNLRFHYIGIDHSNPMRVKYRYKLAGYDNNWSELTQAKYATYTNLDPGKYTFRVKACNANHNWSDQIATAKIYIEPALWQRNWFILLAYTTGIALIAWLAYFFTQRHKRAKRRKAEYDKKLAEMRLLNLKNQLDPHFAFNALNSMASVVLNKQHMEAYDYLTKFSRLTRLTLKDSEDILRTLEQEVEFARHYLDIQKLRFQKKFDYIINIQKDVDTQFLVPKMIIHNFVENALKHGIKNKKEKGIIQIEITQNAEYLRIEITDNGIGRKKAKEINKDSTGKGLKAIKEYIRFFNRYNEKKITMNIEDLYERKNKPAGTKVRISIPLEINYQTYAAT